MIAEEVGPFFRVGLVPLTGLPWLEVLRERHERACVKAARAELALRRMADEQLNEPVQAAAAVRATGRIDEWQRATAAARPVEALAGLSRAGAHERPVGRLRARAYALGGSDDGPPSPGAAVADAPVTAASKRASRAATIRHRRSRDEGALRQVMRDGA